MIFSFGEVLSAVGYREDITLTTIHTNLLMESCKKKMALMIKQSKMDAAKAEQEKKEKEIKAHQIAFGGSSKGQAGVYGNHGSKPELP